IDVMLSDARRHVAFWLTQITLLLCTLATIATIQFSPVTTFHGMVVNDVAGAVLKFFNYLTLAGTLFFSRGYLEERGLFRGETFVLSLFALLGMMVMISASSFITL